MPAAPGTTPWAPPSTPPPVRLSGGAAVAHERRDGSHGLARHGASRDGLRRGGARGARRRVVDRSGTARRATGYRSPLRPPSRPRPRRPPASTARSGRLPAPASAAVVEKAQRTPEPAAARKPEPLVKKPATRRSASRSRGAREGGEAAATAAQSAAAPRVAARSRRPRRNFGAGSGSPAALGEAVKRLLAARERLEPGRKHARSLSREDFQFALDEARVVLQLHPRNPDAKYLATYARGGLAYVAGKDALASALLVEAFTELRRTSRRDVRPIVACCFAPTGRSGSRTAGNWRSGTATPVERRWASSRRSWPRIRAPCAPRRRAPSSGRCGGWATGFSRLLPVATASPCLADRRAVSTPTSRGSTSRLEVRRLRRGLSSPGSGGIAGICHDARNPARGTRGVLVECEPTSGSPEESGRRSPSSASRTGPPAYTR